jgi:hypothetical protein
MLEIFGFSVAVVAFGTLAIGKRISAILAGSVVIGAFLIIRLAGVLLASGDEETFFSVFGAWAWVALLAVFLRFMVGIQAGKAHDEVELF